MEMKTFWLYQVFVLHLSMFSSSEMNEPFLIEDSTIYTVGNSPEGIDSTDVIVHAQELCNCKQIGQMQRCHGRECTAMPRVMSSNVTQLRIRNTAIVTLQVGDLIGYENVVDMELDGNEITYIENGTFRNLNKLVNLTISFNHLSRLEIDCFIGLESLENLRLTNNDFTNFANVVPSLVPLRKLTILRLNDNTFGRIEADDFIKLSNSSIEVLGIANCDLKRISPDALSPLKRLKELNLSENSLDDSNLLALLYNMKDSNLTTLNLSHLRFSGNLPSRLTEVLSRSHVAHLSLQYNILPRLRNTTFVIMPNLRHLDLSHCGIVSIENDTFKPLTHLTHLDLSSNTLLDIPFAVSSLSKLERLSFRDNSGVDSGGGGSLELRNHRFNRMTNLMYLDLRFNRIVEIRHHSFYGLGNLQELILTNSSIYRLVDKCFQPLSALRVLHLEWNVLNKQNFSAHTFEGLVNLEYLNMDSCKISRLSEGLFSAMPNLKYLSLKHNAIQSLDGHDPFVNSLSLVTADLSANEIRGWNSRLFQTSPMLRTLNLADNQISTISHAMFQDFSALSTVSLLYNVMDCDCYLKNLSFLFRNANESQVFIEADNCYSPDYWRYKPISQFLLAVDQIDCEDPEDVILIETIKMNFLPLYVIIPILALIIIGAVVAYLLRSYIRYCLFRWRVRKLTTAARNGKSETGDDRFQYDAFVSYSIEDHAFVMRMVQMLENQEPRFKLCVFERDFTAGNVLNDCILQSITVSRKVILVVSENFVRSQWCLWELHLAQNSLLEENREGLILVVIGKLKAASMPPTLRFLLRTRIYLDWEPDPLKQRIFWDRLRTALRQKKETT